MSFTDVSEAADLPVAPTPAKPQTDVLACAVIFATVSAVSVISPRCVCNVALSFNRIFAFDVLVIRVSDTGTPIRAPVFNLAESSAFTRFEAVSVR